MGLSKRRKLGTTGYPIALLTARSAVSSTGVNGC